MSFRNDQLRESAARFSTVGLSQTRELASTSLALTAIVARTHAFVRGASAYFGDVDHAFRAKAITRIGPRRSAVIDIADHRPASSTAASQGLEHAEGKAEPER